MRTFKTTNIFIILALCAAGCGGAGSTGVSTPPVSMPAAITWTAGGAPLSLAFATWDPSIKAILEAAVQPQDYVVRTITDNDPLIAKRINYTHVFQEPNDTTQGSPPSRSVQAMLTLCPAGSVMIYNIEHWAYTPIAQQLDPAGSILNAAAQVHAGQPCTVSGFPAYVAGAAPDGAFDGESTCTYSSQAIAAFFNELSNGIAAGLPIGGTAWVDSGAGNDWLHIDLYDLQAQLMLSQNPSNQCYGTVSGWWAAVSDRIAHARAGNPNISIWTELSLRDEAPQMIVDAIKYSEQQKAAGVAGPAVYWLAYPLQQPQPPLCPDPTQLPTPPPNSLSTTCFFVSPANLQEELGMLGRATPIPTPPHP